MTTEPCFEGAAFYSLNEDLKDLIKYTKQLSEKEESADMEEKTLFRLSDNEKAEFIAQALNPNFNEEGNWELSAVVLDVYEDYALIANITTGGYQRAYYSKDGDSITMGDVVDVYIVDVTATENAALEAMKAVNGTYEAANTALTDAEAKIAELNSALEATNTTDSDTDADTAPAEEPVDYEAKIAELEATIASKETEIAEAANKYEILADEKIRVESEKADLVTERDSLLEFKKAVETEKKEAVLDKYSEHLSDSDIEKFRSAIDTYSIEDFKKEVCYAAVESSPSILNKDTKEEPSLIYKNSGDSLKSLSGVERLLEKHKKGGNK